MFLAILEDISVGNATAYWNIMSSAGTDGTDVGATLNNKEIAFKTNLPDS